MFFLHLKSFSTFFFSSHTWITISSNLAVESITFDGGATFDWLSCLIGFTGAFGRKAFPFNRASPDTAEFVTGGKLLFATAVPVIVWGLPAIQNCYCFAIL